VLKQLRYAALFILALIALLSFAWYILRTTAGSYNRVSSTAPRAAVSDYEISYTNAGFTPGTLEVPLGARVTFQNHSDIPLWAASDPHPTHTDYPEFDAQKDYLPGQAYTFQFTKSGTFGFHNHERSLDRGIIRVTDHVHDLGNIDKTIVASQRVVRDKYLALLQPGQPESIFTLLDTIEADQGLSSDCHDIAHDLGHRSYELYGFSGAMTYSNPTRLSHTSADDICAGGYIHGILEELFLHQPELKTAPAGICAGIPEINRGSCFHGIGHGLMFANRRDVPVSLGTCQTLGRIDYIHRCYEGVWMEMFWGNTEHAGANSLGWTLEQPLTPCKNAVMDEKPACFLYAHLGYLRTHHYDFAGVVKLCDQSGLGQKDESYCLKGLGITIMKHVTSHHLANSEGLVSGLNSWQKYAYYQGVIGYARLSDVSESYLRNFCGSLKNDGAICFDVLKNGT